MRRSERRAAAALDVLGDYGADARSEFDVLYRGALHESPRVSLAARRALRAVGAPPARYAELVVKLLGNVDVAAVAAALSGSGPDDALIELLSNGKQRDGRMDVGIQRDVVDVVNDMSFGSRETATRVIDEFGSVALGDDGIRRSAWANGALTALALEQVRWPEADRINRALRAAGAHAVPRVVKALTSTVIADDALPWPFDPRWMGPQTEPLVLAVLNDPASKHRYDAAVAIANYRNRSEESLRALVRYLAVMPQRQNWAWNRDAGSVRIPGSAARAFHAEALSGPPAAAAAAMRNIAATGREGIEMVLEYLVSDACQVRPAAELATLVEGLPQIFDMVVTDRRWYSGGASSQERRVGAVVAGLASRLDARRLIRLLDLIGSIDAMGLLPLTTILALTHHADPGIRLRALALLPRGGREAVVSHDRIADAVTGALDDPDDAVVTVALTLTGEMRCGGEAVIKRLGEFLSTPRAEAAVTALYWLRDEAAPVVPALAARLRTALDNGEERIALISAVLLTVDPAAAGDGALDLMFRALADVPRVQVDWVARVARAVDPAEGARRFAAMTANDDDAPAGFEGLGLMGAAAAAHFEILRNAISTKAPSDPAFAMATAAIRSLGPVAAPLGPVILPRVDAAARAMGRDAALLPWLSVAAEIGPISRRALDAPAEQPYRDWYSRVVPDLVEHLRAADPKSSPGVQESARLLAAVWPDQREHAALIASRLIPLKDLEAGSGAWDAATKRFLAEAGRYETRALTDVVRASEDPYQVAAAAWLLSRAAGSEGMGDAAKAIYARATAARGAAKKDRSLIRALMSAAVWLHKDEPAILGMIEDDITASSMFASDALDCITKMWWGHEIAHDEVTALLLRLFDALKDTSVKSKGYVTVYGMTLSQMGEPGRRAAIQQFTKFHRQWGDHDRPVDDQLRAFEYIKTFRSVYQLWGAEWADALFAELDPEDVNSVSAAGWILTGAQPELYAAVRERVLACADGSRLERMLLLDVIGVFETDDDLLCRFATEQFASTDSTVRRRAVYALSAAYGSRGRGLKAFIALAADPLDGTEYPDEDWAQNNAREMDRALGEMISDAGPDAIPALAAALTSAPSAGQERLLRMLARLQPGIEAAAAAIASCDTEAEGVARAALELLRSTEPSAAGASIAGALLVHDDSSVRRAAVRVLSGYGPHAASQLQALRRVLRDPDPVNRDWAIDAITTITVHHGGE